MSCHLIYRNRQLLVFLNSFALMGFPIDHCSNICFHSKLLLHINDYCPKLLIICSNDTEANPGPEKYTGITFCQWNVKEINNHNFSEVSSLQTMATTHYRGIKCLLYDRLS